MTEDAVGLLVASARALRDAAPRSISRDPGQAGRAWDELINALDMLDPDAHAGAPATAPTAAAPAEVDPFGGVGAFVRAAVAVQHEIDRVDDPELSSAWTGLLDALDPGA